MKLFGGPDKVRIDNSLNWWSKEYAAAGVAAFAPDTNIL